MFVFENELYVDLTVGEMPPTGYMFYSPDGCYHGLGGSDGIRYALCVPKPVLSPWGCVLDAYLAGEVVE